MERGRGMRGEKEGGKRWEGRGKLTALERKSRWAWVKGLEGLEAGVGFGEVAALSGCGDEGGAAAGEVAAAATARPRGDV